MSIQMSVPTCPVCSTANISGGQWCRACRSNTIDPTVGRLAEPVKRLGAFLLDIIIGITLMVVSIIPTIFSLIGLMSNNGAAKFSGGLLSFAFLAASIAYIIWCFKLFNQGQSPGKLALGLRVVKSDRTQPGFVLMLLREWIGRLISSMIMSLGNIWILIDPDRQAWHDKFVSTFVVERNP